MPGPKDTEDSRGLTMKEIDHEIAAYRREKRVKMARLRVVIDTNAEHD